MILVMPRLVSDDLSIMRLPWPGGLAAQCSRHREEGAQCLSAASLRAAGVGEPRGHPKGQATANMVLATFAETKVARPPGRNPATFRHANRA